MLLSFALSMPNCGSWDGKWIGADRNYVKVRNLGRGKANGVRAAEILEKGYFHYSFGDGWSAGVTVREAGPNQAARIRKKSDGFCGYDWMIDSIISKMKIVS